MSQSLNVIALISGGKDSLFSLLHCIQNGHKVVALANLHPGLSGVAGELENGAVDEGEDLNSFMYQTIGHSIVPLYASALEIPLYRRAITGSAVHTDRYYDTSAQSDELDETEDLVPLLREVMAKHPEANAVSTGAILSTYQRTRIESVALRLRLAPIAYLWQYPALPPPVEREDTLTGLLDDMYAAGCDARIIKIATGGLKDNMLWTNVADPRIRTRIVSGMIPFFEFHESWLRGAVLGEGGEYETLAINGPPAVWKKRITINEKDNVVSAGEAGVSHISLGRAAVVDQQEQAHHTDPSNLVRVPVLLDQQFTLVRESLTVGTDLPHFTHLPRENVRAESSPAIEIATNFGVSSKYVQINNLTSSHGTTQASSASSQMMSIATTLPGLLASISEQNNIVPSLDITSIVSSTLLIRSMTDFLEINSQYAPMFPLSVPNPPARVTIAAPLPEGIDVSLSLLVDRGPRTLRRGLHVQGRSYWAPANIGPYSQAISVPMTAGSSDINVHDAGLLEIVHMAGQIPLIPQSMELLQNTFVESAILSLQHLWRVGQERGVDCWTEGVVYLDKQSEGNIDSIDQRAETATRVWRATHLVTTHEAGTESTEDEEEIDIWDIQNNRSAGARDRTSSSAIHQHVHSLPYQSHSIYPWVPPCVVAEVVALPRKAPIEWWSTGITGLSNFDSKARVTTKIVCEEDRSISRLNITPDPEQYGTRQVNFITCLFSRPPSSTASGSEAPTNVQPNMSEILQLINHELSSETSASQEFVAGTAFVALHATNRWEQFMSSLSAGKFESAKHSPQPFIGVNTTVIQCHSLWGSPLEELSLELDRSKENPSTSHASSELDMAFIFRVDTS